MKFYNSVGGNPRRVRMFLVEKGIEIEEVLVDLAGGETNSEAYLKLNSRGEVPLLELDNGQVIAESTAICRYLEAHYPTPVLFGTTPEEKAHIEMWDRRMEFHIFGILSMIVRHQEPFFKDKVEQIPELPDNFRRLIGKNWSWLNSEMADGRPFIAGDTFSIADITAMTAMRNAGWLKALPSDEDEHVNNWVERVKTRDSWDA